MNATQLHIHHAKILLEKMFRIRDSHSRTRMGEMEEWSYEDAEEMHAILTDAFNLADDDYPDQQLSFNHEIQTEIERQAS